MIEGDVVDVIDVRDVPAGQAGHIPGARHVSLGRFRGAVNSCAPAGPRGKTAAQLAVAAGLDEVHNLEGRTRAWVDGRSIDRRSRAD